MSPQISTAVFDQFEYLARQHQDAAGLDPRKGAYQLLPKRANSNVVALINRAVSFGRMQAYQTAAREVQGAQGGHGRDGENSNDRACTEISKLARAKEHRESLGEFLDWMRESGLAFCAADAPQEIVIASDEVICRRFDLDAEALLQERRAVLSGITVCAPVDVDPRP